MGRWGHRLFEGDQDIDIALELNSIIPGTEIEFSQMIHQTDMLAPQEARAFYKTKEYKDQLAEDVIKMRQKLDSGLGDQVMAKCRSAEPKEDSSAFQDPFRDPKYNTILAGALLMRAGAKLKPEDIQHLREIVPKINCNYGYTLPLFDQGFRYPGKLQFLAALDHYVAGTPRNFQVPSCFACGKIEDDTGSSLKKCSGCEKVWYCNKECQRKEWKKHKPTCMSDKQAAKGRGFMSLNV